MALMELGHRPIVITKPDKPSGRNNRIQSTPVKKAALEMNLEVWTPENLKSSEIFEKILEKKPVLIVTAAYGEYIPSRFLELPSRGCINVHPSMLPKYRGAAPVQRALMAGETETGVSIATVAEKWDSGDILLQESFAISPVENAATLLEKLANRGAALLKKVVPMLLEGDAKRIPQDEGKATYAEKIQDKDLWIDWNLPAEKIANQVRGLAPDPGARSLHREVMIKVLKAQAVQGIGAPGTILRLEQEGPVVAAGANSVLFLEAQPQNRNVMSGRDFVNGFRLQVGEKFSS